MKKPQRLVAHVMSKGKINQEQLGKLLGVTGGAVSHWLNGNNNPSATNLEGLERLKRIFEAKDKALASGVLNGTPKRSVEDSIALQAHRIVNERAEEKERQYGDFHKTMRRANDILKAIMGIELPEQTMYFAMIAMKLSREGHAHKRDNLLDAMAYMQALENLENVAVNE